MRAVPIENERLYYELRAQHRRNIATMCLLSLLLAAIAYSIWAATGTMFALVTTYLCVVSVVLGTVWLMGNYQGGRWRRIADSIFDETGDWPADLKAELRERGEL